MESISTETIYYLFATFTLFGIGQHSWRRAAAQRTAEKWLLQHQYRVRELRTRWFRWPMFAPKLFRDTDNAFDFEATVDDRALGGTGKLFLRVWTNWLGEVDQEVEVIIDQMSEGSGEAQPLFERLADAQVELLRRIADGETALYAPRRSEGGEADFDRQIEHVLALSRRGMITAGTPRMDNTATHYTSIGDLAITPEGRSWLHAQDSETDTAARAREAERGG